MLFIITIPTFVLLGIFLRIFERPVVFLSDQDFHSLLNSIWCVVISLSGVGYGDYVPFSLFGRLIIIIGIFCGGFIFSMIIV